MTWVVKAGTGYLTAKIVDATVRKTLIEANQRLAMKFVSRDTALREAGILSLRNVGETRVVRLRRRGGS